LFCVAKLSGENQKFCLILRSATHFQKVLEENVAIERVR
jgi:hypothetical protein